MKEHPNTTHFSEPLVHLTNTFEKMARSDKVVVIYNKETCYEFHFFLIALLFAYTKGLIALKKKWDMTLGREYYKLAIVFWKVASSSVLHIHLYVLDTVTGDFGTALAMPNYQWKSVYVLYFEGSDGWVNWLANRNEMTTNNNMKRTRTCNTLKGFLNFK